MKTGFIYLLVVYLVLFVFGFYLNNKESFLTGRFNHDIKADDFDDFTAKITLQRTRRVGERCYADYMCISGKCDLSGRYGCKNKCRYTEEKLGEKAQLASDNPNAHIKNCPMLTNYSSGALSFQVPGIKCRGPGGLKSTTITKPFSNTSNSSIPSWDDYPEEPKRVGEICMRNSDCRSEKCDHSGNYGCKNKCIKKQSDIDGLRPLVVDDPKAHLINCPVDNGTLSGSLLADSAETYKPIIKNFKDFKDNINCSR